MGWENERERVNAELRRLGRIADENCENITKMRIAIGVLQAKSGIWGGLAGAVVAIGAILLSYAKHG